MPLGVWPSEEILAHYCLKNIHQFKKRRVCELAAGSGLAAITIAMALQHERSECDVLITDGNQQAASHIEKNLQENGLYNGGNSRVSAMQLLWSDSQVIESAFPDRYFDCIIAADCLFLKEFHQDLLHLIPRLVKTGGTVYILSPRRGDSLETFINLLKGREDLYEWELQEQYDNEVWNIHCNNIQTVKDYNPDIHFPLMCIIRMKT